MIAEKNVLPLSGLKYQRYKELQRKIDENLDYDMNDEK